MDETQQRLFDIENPLRTCFNAIFFKQIPTSPGVYWMLDNKGEILYIGKAKDLRARLNSYRSRRFERLPAKTQRLLKRVHTIEWQELASEAQALIRENELLRILKPPYNVANVSPETYLFFGYRTLEHGLEIRLLFDVASAPGDLRIFGAFKGIARVRRAHSSVLRWVWAKAHENCEWPIQLLRKTAPFEIFIPCSSSNDNGYLLREVIERLELFFSGLIPLEELVLPQESPSGFMQSLWKDDQIRLQKFFKSCSSLKSLKAHFALGAEQVISQTSLNDFLALRRLGLRREELGF